MPFPAQMPKPFNRRNIETRKPQLGCYGLYVNQGNWVYVGKGDIRQRLLDHLNGDNACINQSRPTHWVDVVTADADNEEKRLIRELRPVCNKHVGSGPRDRRGTDGANVGGRPSVQ